MSYFSFSSALARFTLGRAEQVNSIFQEIADSFATIPAATLLQSGRVSYAADSGVADAYVVSVNPTAIMSYETGLTIMMKAGNANTGASSINVNSLGVKSIRRYDGEVLEADDIRADMLCSIVYDGTYFRLVGVHGGEAALVRRWAVATDAPVADSEFSAKEYAHGSQAATGGSSKNWAQETGAITGGSANDRSSKSWAQADLTGATLGGSAKDWGQYTGGAVDGSNYSAKAHATSSGVVPAGSAKDWASKTDAAVASGEFSAKAHAASSGVVTAGSAKEWAVKTDAVVITGEYSAKAHAASEGLISEGSAKEWATSETEVDGGYLGARGYALLTAADAVSTAANAASASSARDQSVAAAAALTTSAMTFEQRFQLGGFV